MNADKTEAFCLSAFIGVHRRPTLFFSPSQHLPLGASHHIGMNLRGFVLGSTLLFAASAVFYAQQKTPLPPPFATPTVNNGPHVVRQPEGAKLSVPPGFQVEIYQEGFKVPRFMLLGPSNEVLLSDAARGTSGTVYVLQGKERKALIEG